jgi:versiconal hemiacetal acetate esterase
MLNILTILDDKKINPEVMVRVYTPKQKSDRPLPVGVFGHGGGFCGGDLNSDDKTARFLAEHLPCIVISIDYRLGPRYKFPTMLNDFEAGFNWVSKSIEVYWGALITVISIPS